MVDFGEASAAFLKTLQRQHKVTIRRLDSIQRKLNALPEEGCEEEPKEWSIVDWFLSLIRGKHSGR